MEGRYKVQGLAKRCSLGFMIYLPGRSLVKQSMAENSHNLGKKLVAVLWILFSIQGSAKRLRPGCVSFVRVLYVPESNWR